MRRVLAPLIAAAVVGAGIAAQGAGAQSPPAPAATASPGAGWEQQPAAPPPAPPPPKPANPVKVKPAPAPEPGKQGGEKSEKGVAEPEEAAVEAPVAPLPHSCGPTAVPPVLIPIYQAASEKYELGPSGPSILAAINEIESGFGQNLGPSSAGALGWMQFMPSTWDAYGVDADGDGKADPNDPEDAIFAAARYLSASGMPEDPEGAIFAYNHADWYVADVMARAACFGGIGNGAIGSLSLIPTHQQLVCAPAKGVREAIPAQYLKVMQTAAGRYDLGEDGLWAIAAVARLESDFGRAMSPAELALSGPFGINEENWAQFAVDGDGDGKPMRDSAADAASTLARMIWASGSLKAGLFQHNHASWYVDAVLEEAEGMAGKCDVRTVAYAVALPGPTSVPINWENVELSNSLEMWDLQRGAIDPRVVGLIGAISQEHEILISSLRSDHSMNTASGNVSNHFYGRAVDIAAIDGVPCTVTDVDSPCGVIARSLAALPPGQKPTELIFCFDPDGPAPEGFAAADHCDHIHAGYNE
jgi:Transglycosylase SLT domain